MKRTFRRACRIALAASVFCLARPGSAEPVAYPTTVAGQASATAPQVYGKPGQVDLLSAPAMPVTWEKPPWWKFWKRPPQPHMEHVTVPAGGSVTFGTAESPYQPDRQVGPGRTGSTAGMPVVTTSKKIWPPTPSQQVKPASGARVAEGTVSFDNAPAAAAPASGPVSSSALEYKVRATLGPLARDVRVVRDTDGGLRVRVTTAGEGAEKLLIDRLTRVPELAAPEVRLEVLVNP